MTRHHKRSPLRTVPRGMEECGKARMTTGEKCKGGKTEPKFGLTPRVGPTKSPLTSDCMDFEGWSGSETDLISVGSFNSFSSRSSSESGDTAQLQSPEGGFDFLQQGEEQEQLEHAAKSHGRPPLAPRRPNLESRKDSYEEVVCPAHWSERQRELARQGPMQCQSVTASELLWWAGVRARSLLLLCLIFCAQYYVLAVVLLPAFLLQRQHAALAYCGFGSLMEEASILHFGHMRVIRDSPDPFEPQGKYIFGYHPHGNLPAVLAWFPFTDAWRTLFPSIHPVGLVATAIFKVPVLRDLCLRAGIQEVSRRTFMKTLQEKAAVVLCPGGQAEIAAHRHSSHKQVVLSAQKTGFIRIAVESGAKLVPVFVFGECQLLDNPFNLPTAQKLTYKVFGFPIPFMPLGLFGFLPIPKTGPLTLVVGRPLDPRKLLSPLANGAEPQDLERIRVAYYNNLQELFEKYKERLGFGDWELLLQNK